MYHPCVQGLVPLNSSVPQFLQPLIIDTAHSMHSCAVFLTHEGLQSQTYPQGCQWQEVPDSKCDGKEGAKDNVLMGSRNILQDSCEIGRLLSWCPLRPLPSWGVLFLGNTRLEVLAGRHFLRHSTCGPLTPWPTGSSHLRWLTGTGPQGSCLQAMHLCPSHVCSQSTGLTNWLSFQKN